MTGGHEKTRTGNKEEKHNKLIHAPPPCHTTKQIAKLSNDYYGVLLMHWVLLFLLLFVT